jgi:glycosyltransferase involved in cell wall biosynthesis
MEPQQTSRRVTLVAGELLGYVRTGGLGTATTFLSLALARMGHAVDVLYTGAPGEGPTGEWGGVYERAGVRIRPLEGEGPAVEPPAFALPRRVELALRDDPPDVVIAQDLAAPAYSMVRLRQLGLGFERTLFVVYCHGTRQWITDVSGKVRVLPGALAVTALERAALELADVVVSPSAYLVGWMRRQGWRLPERTWVIPYLTRAGATGEQQPRAEANAGPIRRLAFFGRLEERKGVRPFAAGVSALEPELLERLELEFVGRATPAWPPARVEGLLSESARRSLRGISFHTDLDQTEALASLSRPGTLAVMPSLEDNSPNAVYECLEHGIPFIAGSAGGAGELVAPEDRDAALLEPTAAGVEAALRRVLTSGNGQRPPRPAFDQQEAVARWADVVAQQPEPRPVPAEPVPADCVLVPEGAADDDLRATLLRAQAASGTDVVTCGVTVPDGGEQLFVGDPGGLGVLSNAYGTVALVRRNLVTDSEAGVWPLLARLSASGARIVSIPLPLATSTERPGDVASDPRGALAVARELEQALPESLRSLARLAAGLAAEAQRPPAPPSRLRRLFRR